MDILERFVTLWVVIDPIGTIPVFIAVTAGMASGARRKTALLATIASIGVLLFFLVFGQLLIDALGISLLSFQVAGGIILFLFALTMIFGESKPEADKRSVESGVETANDTAEDTRPSPAIFPLAVPSLASPGAMLAIVLLTDNNQFAIADQVLTGVVMIGILGIAFIFMLLADPIIRLIGNSGAAIVSRVMGMILASVAADAVLSAIVQIVQTGSL